MSWEKRVVVYRLCSSYVLFVFLLAKCYGTELVSVGVILDSSNEVGNISRSYMEMARSDFYKAHPNYTTRLRFHFRDPKDDVVDAATAALDLIKNEEVDAIIGPEWSTQAKFVIELGQKAQVPIISFSATSPSLSPTQNPYFVRTAYNDSSQVKAIAAIIQAFDWREVSIIYEDTEYGNGLISYLTDSFQDVEIRIPYRSAITPSSPTLQVDILKTLNELLRMHTRVFLVHMTGQLGYQFFIEANNAQMLNENTAWIVTDGLSSLVDPVIGGAAFAMEGVVGVRPYLSKASTLAFDKRMEANANLKGTMKLNLFGLWAYDTVTALSTAVESAWKSDLSEPKRKSFVAPNSLNFTTPPPSKIGNKILQGMRKVGITHGLSGDFHLVEGQLQTSAFDVFNVVGNEEQAIGYWTSKHGLSKDVLVTRREYSTLKEDLMKAPTWPGKTRNIPKGWVIPVKGHKQIKIAVPLKTRFREFFKIEWDQYTDEPKYSGFSYDVFLAVLENLPFNLPYKIVPFINKSRLRNGSYSDMLFQISQKTVDAVVADMTITLNRSQYVDFTLPYSESGVRMLVAIKDNYRDDMWIFVRPLSTNLWLTTALAFICNGLVVFFLERHNNEDFEGSWYRKLHLSLWFSFSTLVFEERVVSSWTRLVVIVWVFMVLIITQSYAANLASLLTVQQLNPKYTNVQDILSNGVSVGYQKGAFVKDEVLIKQIKFPNNDSILIPYETVEQFHEALSNGHVAAIFDEIPYIRLFLAKYCNKFMMVGPTYKSDGFGFAFPRNSPLVPYISRAILAVTENKTRMDNIEENNNLSHSLCIEQSENDGATFINKDNARLSLYSFLGLFIIVGAVALFSICSDLIYTNRHVLLSNVKDWYGRFSTFYMIKILEKLRDRLASTRNR